ncbi:MAG: hypothetical protein PVI20_19540, partial [Desulfobacteraceae bacterium]
CESCLHGSLLSAFFLIFLWNVFWLFKDISYFYLHKGTPLFLGVEDSLAVFAVDTPQEFPYLSARKVGVFMRIHT